MDLQEQVKGVTIRTARGIISLKEVMTTMAMKSRANMASSYIHRSYPIPHRADEVAGGEEDESGVLALLETTRKARMVIQTLVPHPVDVVGEAAGGAAEGAVARQRWQQPLAPPSARGKGRRSLEKRTRGQIKKVGKA